MSIVKLGRAPGQLRLGPVGGGSLRRQRVSPRPVTGALQNAKQRALLYFSILDFVNYGRQFPQLNEIKEWTWYWTILLCVNATNNSQISSSKGKSTGGDRKEANRASGGGVQNRGPPSQTCR